jgi:hypothetical protein
MNAHVDIRIGTLVPAHDRTPEVIRQLLPHGFETFQIRFGKGVAEMAINAWIGNSARMRHRHYHSVRPEDWAAVTGIPAPNSG